MVALRWPSTGDDGYRHSLQHRVVGGGMKECYLNQQCHEVAPVNATKKPPPQGPGSTFVTFCELDLR